MDYKEKKISFYSLFSGHSDNEVILNSTFEGDFFDFFSGIKSYNKVIETTVKFGSVLYDVLYFDDGVNFVISEKLYQLLMENNIYGWKTYPVSIKNISQKYYGFQITGRTGELIEPSEKGFYRGYKFDINTWDGSDFFSPKGTSLRFMTLKLKEILIDNRITNIDISNINDTEAFSFGKN